MRRPGNLRDLGDTWVNIQDNKDLAKAEEDALEAQSTAYIDSRSGSARSAPMRSMNTLTPAQLSSPAFIMQHTAWYRDYMRKLMDQGAVG